MIKNGKKQGKRSLLTISDIFLHRNGDYRSFTYLVFLSLVRARTGVRRELAARADMNVLRWSSYVDRMDNERMLKKVMNAKVDGRSARGRPRFGWMDGVKRALNDRRMNMSEASERARNRNEWRMIVTQF